MAEICRNLTTFNVFIDSSKLRHNALPNHTNECAPSVRQGDVRRLLEAMPKLESLTVGFAPLYELDGTYPARLEDLVSTTTHWPYLSHLNFDTVEAPRQDLIDFFSRHSRTLRTIELRDLNLIRSSWRVFLPQLQELAESMFLDNILIAGRIKGEAEQHIIAPESREECFDCDDPASPSTPCLSAYITDYIIGGQGPNPLDNVPDVRE